MRGDRCDDHLVSISAPRTGKPFTMPTSGCFRPDTIQRTAPACPQSSKGDPEHAIERSQCWLFKSSLEGRELHSEAGVLDGDGLVAAQHAVTQGFFSAAEFPSTQSAEHVRAVAVIHAVVLTSHKQVDSIRRP